MLTFRATAFTYIHAVRRRKLNFYAKRFIALKLQTNFPAEIVADLMTFRSILKP